MRNSPLNIIAFILVIVGALNWGLVGLFSFDLVAAIFGTMSTVSRVVYVLVALAGIYLLFARITARSTVAHTNVDGSINRDPR